MISLAMATLFEACKPGILDFLFLQLKVVVLIAINAKFVRVGSFYNHPRFLVSTIIQDFVGNSLQNLFQL